MIAFARPQQPDEPCSYIDLMVYLDHLNAPHPHQPWKPIWPSVWISGEMEAIAETDAELLCLIPNAYGHRQATVIEKKKTPEEGSTTASAIATIDKERGIHRRMLASAVITLIGVIVQIKGCDDQKHPPEKKAAATPLPAHSAAL